MGGQHQVPKPPALQQGRHHKDLGVLQGGALKAPDIPTPAPGTRWLKASRQWWANAWTESIAETWTSSDRPMVVRLLSLVETRERAYRGVAQGLLVKGSMGQLVLNPVARYMLSLDGEIRQLEDRLGLSPRSRLQLGVTMGDAHRSLASLTAAMGEDDDDDDSDPRIIDAGAL